MFVSTVRLQLISTSVQTFFHAKSTLHQFPSLNTAQHFKNPSKSHIMFTSSKSENDVTV